MFQIYKGDENPRENSASFPVNITLKKLSQAIKYSTFV